MICPKCHYQRRPSDTAPQWQCPACGVAYSKATSASASTFSLHTRIATAELPTHESRFGKRTSTEIGLNLLVVLSLVLLAAAWYLKDRLPPPSEISKSMFREPIQTPTRAKPFDFDYRNETYMVTPVADYELWGMVVSHNDIHSFIDITHDKNSVDIKDLCVIWGGNLVSEDYQKVQYSSGDFTCYWSYRGSVVFQSDKISNNHLLSDNATVRQRIREAQIGDQIHFKGMLVNYSPLSHPSWVRKTSTTRKDTGNHACEVVFVKSFEIVRAGNSISNSLYRFAKWLVLIAVLARIGAMAGVPFLTSKN